MKSLNQMEREFLYHKLGSGGSGEPLNNLRRRYYASLGLVDSPQNSLSELEGRWLDYYIADGALIPESDTSGKWRQMVELAGGVPSNNINENRRVFFLLTLAGYE